MNTFGCRMPVPKKSYKLGGLKQTTSAHFSSSKIYDSSREAFPLTSESKQLNSLGVGRYWSSVVSLPTLVNVVP